MITINSLIKEYNSRNKSVLALDNVSINIPSGSIFGIIGKSGSGKSTLLQIVGAMEKPTSGSIVVDGFSIEKMNKTNLSKFRREKIGFVFQSFYLQNYLNVYENVELPMIGKNIKSFEKKDRVHKVLELVGLKDKIYSKVSELSGGQLQRVAIARGLINNAKILLMDEPTGNLDSATRDSILKLIQNINRNFGATIVVVTHDKEVSKICNETIELENGRVVKRT